MIRIGAPNADHELIVRTDSSALIDTGRRWDIHVGDILHEVVDGDVLQRYHAFKSEEVLNDQVVETYKGHSTTVHTKHWQEYAQQKKLVKGLFKETIGIHDVTITGGGRKEDITGGLEQTVSGGPGAVQTVNGDKVTNVTGNWLQTIHGTVNQTVLGSVTHIKGDVHTLVTIGATSDTFIGVKNANFYQLRILLCTNCGAPIEIPRAGGQAACRYCNAVNQRAMRDERPSELHVCVPSLQMPASRVPSGPS